MFYKQSLLWKLNECTFILQLKSQRTYYTLDIVILCSQLNKNNVENIITIYGVSKCYSLSLLEIKFILLKLLCLTYNVKLISTVKQARIFTTIEKSALPCRSSTWYGNLISVTNTSNHYAAHKARPGIRDDGDTFDNNADSR